MTRPATVLVGNGLSIAFNAELGLRSITEEMLRRIEDQSEDGSVAVAAMKNVAAQALPDGATTDEDFEILVGAFGSEQRTLEYLSRLAAALRPGKDDLADAVAKVMAFATEVRDTGISHVLEVIFERSYAAADRTERLRDFVAAVVHAFDGQVTFGNLNYDALLLSGMLSTCQEDMADLGHGWKKIEVTTDGVTHSVPALRREPSDFPITKRVHLLQLHGSLTFWADRDKDIFAKLDTSFLRQHELWKAVREGEVNVRPVVVLANQKDKSAHVSEFPFSLAYRMFQDSLRLSNNWLIVGYSFRDACVNDILRAEFSDRVAAAKPKVLVVTHGDSPACREVERAFGWGAEDGDSANWLSVIRSGADSMSSSDEWGDFIA